MTSSTVNKFKNFIASPQAILGSVVLGAIIGTQSPQLSSYIAPLGNIYLNLFKMCVFPILISGIIVSVARLISRNDSTYYVKRILFYFPIFLISTSLIAVLVGFIFNPGKGLDGGTLQALGVLVNQSAVDLQVNLTGALAPVESGPGLSSFLVDLIPSNIIYAVGNGDTLPVLFFCIASGIALGVLPQGQTTEPLMLVLESVYSAFQTLITWLKYLLPFGLLGLLAEQLSEINMSTVSVMSNFLLISILTFGLLFLLSIVLLSARSKYSIKDVLFKIKEPLLLAFTTQSSLACLPSAIDSLTNGLRFENKSTNLVLPLAITLCRFGPIAYFAIATIFVSSLYQSPLEFGDILILIAGSIFAGMATSGLSGVLTLTMLSIVLSPLGLPLDAVLVLLIAIDPLINPFRTLTIVGTSITVSSFISEQTTDEQGLFEGTNSVQLS
ncbi:dicarboxylate/amino acid:cation symporter [Synechococcus sp. AH-601-O20]|nr:dicarboxylate/amino acid:cation symporter [Synechococcus sp. AH-601-O20]